MPLGRLPATLQRGRSKDKSLAFFHGEAATSSVENAGVAFQSPSVIAMGGNAQTVSELSAFSNLVLAVLLFTVPKVVEKWKGSLKRTTVLISVINTITWLPLAVVMLLTGVASPALLCVLWIVNLVPSVIGYPLRDEWLASLVPAERMGRYLSVRSAFVGAFYLGAFLAMGLIIENTGQHSASYGYVFGLALLASLASTFLYVAIRLPPVTDTPVSSPLTLSEFFRNCFRQHAGLFVVFVSLYAFAVNLAGPLFAFYMLDEIKLSISMFTGMIAAEYVSRIASLSFWGRLVDRRGAITIMNWSARLIPLVPLLWILSANPGYLVAVQLISGVAWAAFDLSVQSYLSTATKPEHRLRLIVYHRSLSTLGAALGALAGGAILMRVFPLNGSHVLGLFLVSGILRMILAMAFLPKLTWQEGHTSIYRSGRLQAVQESRQRGRVAVFHYPSLWPQFMLKAKMGNVSGRTVPSVFRRGLYNRNAAGRDVSFDRTHTAARVNVNPVRVSKLSKGSRPALFRHPELWAGYIRHSLSLDAYGTESRFETSSNPRRGHISHRLASKDVFSTPSGRADYGRRMPLYSVRNHTAPTLAKNAFSLEQRSHRLRVELEDRDVRSGTTSSLLHKGPSVSHVPSDLKESLPGQFLRGAGVKLQPVA